MKMDVKFESDIAFDKGTPTAGELLMIHTLGAIGFRTFETIKRIGTEIFRIDLSTVKG